MSKRKNHADISSEKSLDIEQEAINQLCNYSAESELKNSQFSTFDNNNQVSNNSWRLLSNNNKCFVYCKLPKSHKVSSSIDSYQYNSKLKSNWIQRAKDRQKATHYGDISKWCNKRNTNRKSFKSMNQSLYVDGGGISHNCSVDMNSKHKRIISNKLSKVPKSIEFNSNSEVNPSLYYNVMLNFYKNGPEIKQSRKTIAKNQMSDNNSNDFEGKCTRNQSDSSKIVLIEQNNSGESPYKAHDSSILK